MTIILFLVDTSASMCQKAYVNGVQKSYLDIAKGAVETFLKYRQRTQDCMGDRYMLLTFEEPPANVKAGWKENHATFMNELKNLQSTGLTTMGESLKNAFDLLNLNRMQSGIDTYGQGRCPFYLEPSVIIVISDGGRYSFRNGVHQEIILPLNTQIPGTKFTKEPFRWDQRLYSLVLRMSGNKIDERVEGKVPHDDSPIERMCEVTGGRSYRVRSQYVLNQCIESLVQKVQPGVVLQFEPMLPKDGIPNEALQDIVFQPMKKMIYVQKHISQKTFLIGCWPLPEPYWPDPKAVALPPRDAHPKLKVVTPAVDEPQMVRNFPVDKYEIEASPLTLQILQKREPNKVWQVIISNGMHGFDLPFGYLKAAPNFSQVHLYVLAYNYPALLPLLHDLIHKYNMSPPNDLMYKFNAYVRSIPPYYCPFLRKALNNINVPFPLLQFLLPENVDNYLSPNIANQLKHIKNTAKQEQENLCMKVYKQLKQPKPPYRQVETAKLNPGVPLRRDLVRHPLLRDTFAKLHSEIEPIENYTIVVPQITRQASAKTYRNPFDIPRRDLIEEIARMRETFLRPSASSLVAKDSGHCLPIAEMGNYQEYLKNKDIPLREIEPTNVRQHMFGNPYKKDKHMVMVDEADLSDVAPMKANNGAGGPGAPGAPNVKKHDVSRARKRKAGPIRRDYVFRRVSIDALPGAPAYTSSSASSTAGSSVGSLSDFDDDSMMSDTSSVGSAASEDGDPDRLVVAFDFGEEEQQEQDFPLNGYVTSFINGADDNSCDNEAAAAASAAGNSAGVAGGGGAIPGAGSVALAAGTASNPGGLPSAVGSPALGGDLPQPMAMPLMNSAAAITASALHLPPGMNGLGMPLTGHPVAPAATPNPYMTPYGSMLMGEPMLGGGPVTPPTSIYTPQTQMNGYAAAAAAAAATQPIAITPPAQLSLQPPAPGALLGQPVSPTSPVGFTQNDINDPLEISRILQQCHNGAPVAVAEGYAPADIKEEPPESTLMPPPPTAGLVANHHAAATLNHFDSLKREANNSNIALNHNNNNTNSTSNHTTGSGSAAATRGKLSASPVSPVAEVAALTEEQRDAARKHNLDIRTQVFRDIRRPGRDYSQLLDNLNMIEGDLDMKSNFIQMCISESMRFRRRQMVNSIQEWWDKKQQQLQQPQQPMQTSSS